MNGDLNGVQGVWFLPDDAAFKFWKLEEFTFQLGEDKCLIRDIFLQDKNWFWWNAKLRSLQWKNIGVGVLKKYLQNTSSFRANLYASLDCAPPKCFERATSTMANSDTLYLPNTKVIDKFIEVIIVEVLFLYCLFT